LSGFLYGSELVAQPFGLAALTCSFVVAGVVRPASPRGSDHIPPGC
jgi:hypothetical protein